MKGIETEKIFLPCVMHKMYILYYILLCSITKAHFITDLDECAARPDLCTTIKGAVCSNTLGSYECKCEQDNQKIEGDECVDNVSSGDFTYRQACILLLAESCL